MMCANVSANETGNRSFVQPRGWRLLACVGLFMAAGHAAAVNKCIGADGRITYTDGPCGGAVRAERIETPPPLSRAEQAAAMWRSERLVGEARALDARRAREQELRRLQDEELRQQEAMRQRQIEREETEHAARMAAVPMYAAPIYPVYPRYRPPIVVPVPLRPQAPPPAPAQMRPYPFR